MTDFERVAAHDEPKRADSHIRESLGLGRSLHWVDHADGSYTVTFDCQCADCHADGLGDGLGLAPRPIVNPGAGDPIEECCPTCGGSFLGEDLIDEYRRLLALGQRFDDLTKRAGEWRRSRWPDCSPSDVLMKATEELGEIARAQVGVNESREGRGDAPEEAAQLVLVLASFVGMFYPERDLAAEVLAEQDRLS